MAKTPFEPKNKDVVEALDDLYDVAGPGQALKPHDVAAMTPLERLRLVVGWHIGSQGWADSFVAWARDCGMVIDEDPK